MLVKKPYILDFGQFGDEETGYYSHAEYAKSLPFEPERVFWMYDTPLDTSRGNIAHIASRMVLFPIVGKADVYLEDLAGKTHQFELAGKDKGLFIPEKTWQRINVSEGTVLLCFASEKFNKKDLVKDYRDFKKLKKR